MLKNKCCYCLMSTITFQIAGEFIESDKSVYYADNFDLYFYETDTSDNAPSIITKSFCFISAKELEENKLYSSKEFMLYESKADIKTVTYDLDHTNIQVPAELVEENICKLTDMYMKTANEGKKVIKELISPTEDYDIEGIADIINISDLHQNEGTANAEPTGMEDINFEKLSVLSKMVSDIPNDLKGFKDQLKMNDVDEDDVENIVM